MRVIGRVPLVVLVPLALVVAVVPAFAMDQVGWQSSMSRSLSLVWVMAVGVLLADQVRRRRASS